MGCMGVHEECVIQYRDPLLEIVIVLSMKIVAGIEFNRSYNVGEVSEY